MLHELKPEFRGASHAWKSQDFEADDDFFRYMLPQMTVSCAHLDKKKQGRSLCEIFGPTAGRRTRRKCATWPTCFCPGA